MSTSKNVSGMSPWSAISMVLAVAAFIGIGYLVLAQLKAADLSEASLTVTNTGPSLDTPILTTSSTWNATPVGFPLALAEGSQYVYVQVVGNDANGCADIDTTAAVAADLWESGVSPAAVGATGDDQNSEYSILASDATNITVVGGSCTGGTNQSTQFIIRFAVVGRMDAAATWKARVYLNDESGSTTVNATTAENEISTLRALDVTTGTATATFAAATAGQYTGTTAGADTTGINGVPVTIRNTGNQSIDTQIVASQTGTVTALTTDFDASGDVACTVGNIKLNDFHYDLTASVVWSSMTQFAATYANLNQLSGFNLGAGTTDGAESEKTIYFKLKVPVGISGSCGMRLTFSAENDV